MTGLGAEVVWTRQLSLMLGATVYTFSNILAVFLLGAGDREQLWVLCGALRERCPRGAGMVSVAAGGGDCVGGIQRDVYAAVLAD